MLYLLLNTMLSASLQGYIIGNTELIRPLICWSPTMSAVHVVLLFFLNIIYFLSLHFRYFCLNCLFCLFKLLAVYFDYHSVRRIEHSLL